MFGILTPCHQHLDTELSALWRAHMCGLCLELGASHGQTARLTTNTDAVMISVLTSAQRARPAELGEAGRCPLRGMRRAEVVVGAEPGIRLAATTSLTLAAAKAADVTAEQRHGLARPSRVRARAAGYAARHLRRAATRSPGLDAGRGIAVDDVLRTLSHQADVEAEAAELVDLLDPTAHACAQVFAATADAAGVPDNRADLWAIGADFGAIAHLLDAIDDYETDHADGAFNPLRATGTGIDSAIDDCRRLANAIRRRYESLRLEDDRLLRAVLLDGLGRAISTRARQHGRSTSCHHSSGRHAPHTSAASPTEWPPTRPSDYPSPWPYPPPFPPQRGFFDRLGPFLWTMCSGKVCCTDHWNHCSDGWKSACCDCDCDCGDDCDCDCDCCDCDCCDCDCDCNCP